MDSTDSSGLNPVYFETRFETEAGAIVWPGSFAIITAYATTGEKWTLEQNEAADRQLANILRERGVLVSRITGYSPKTGHAEPGWAAAVDFDAACELGREFKQDAIYFVDGDLLSVSRCARPQRIRVGTFPDRLRAADDRSVMATAGSPPSCPLPA